MNNGPDIEMRSIRSQPKDESIELYVNTQEHYYSEIPGEDDYRSTTYSEISHTATCLGFTPAFIKKEYFVMRIKWFLRKFQSPLLQSFCFSLIFTASMCIMRILIMHIFQQVEYNQPEKNAPYTLAVFYIQVFDMALSISSFAIAFFLRNHSIIEMVIKCVILVAHVLFMVAVVALIRADRIYMLEFVSVIYASAEVAGIFIIMRLCRCINRIPVVIYNAVIFFVVYYLISLFATWRLWSFGMYTSNIRLGIMRRYLNRMQELGHKSGFITAGFRPIDLGASVTDLQEVILRYLRRANNLKISIALAAASYFSCYKIVLRVKEKYYEGAETDEETRKELNILKTIGMFLHLQLLMCVLWVIILNVSLLNVSVIVNSSV